MAHPVKCMICGARFDRDKEPCTQIGKRYAHVLCAQGKEDQLNKEQIDKYNLEEYLKALFNTSVLDLRVRKQIQQFVDEYNYTYSGIMKTLDYFFRIQNNHISKANGGIGIVPYVYRQAEQYFYSVWLANQTNANLDTSLLSSGSERVVIPVPSRPASYQKTKFDFLEFEEENC